MSRRILSAPRRLPPEAVVAYSLETLGSYADGAGLRMGSVNWGYWADQPGWAVNEQDMILFGR